MRWLAQHGAFPLERFVVVDSDRVKSLLPEMPALVAANPALAGTLTQQESGFIAELVEQEAMKRGRNVLVDGSLRNAAWYTASFARIRARFPTYRIAILLVTASRERIYERAARRALVTGRDVPRHVLDEAFAQVPLSFAALAPLADYTATLVNEDDRGAPTLLPPANLASFARVWDDGEGGERSALARRREDGGGNGSSSSGRGGEGDIIDTPTVVGNSWTRRGTVRSSRGGGGKDGASEPDTQPLPPPPPL